MTLSPQRQWKQDQRDLAKHQTSARKVFRGLIKSLKPDAEQAKELYPKDVKKQGRYLAKLLRVNTRVQAFLEEYMGTDEDSSKTYSWRNSGMYLLRDVSTGAKLLRDAQKKLDQISGNGFRAITMSRVQSPLRKTLPEELRAFLPPNIVVEVDKNGYIKRVTDKFVNERLDLAEKIARQRSIVSQYNMIVKNVKSDLRSPDEITRLAALVTAIIMETGIRPGKAGNAAIKTVDGEKIEVETFGAITLGPAHVRFVKNNFAELEFVGKKGGVNTASLSDTGIIKVLQDYVDKAQKGGSKFIFLTADGTRFSYSDLQRYFRSHFKGISPTDFRKLRATQAMLAKIRGEQEALYEDIRGFIQDQGGDLRERIIGALVGVLDDALEAAQVALSHDSPTTTRDAYINPNIILQFLSTGRAAQTLEAAMMDSRTQLTFDPMTFVQIAGSMAVAAAWVKQSADVTLRELLEQLEEDLDL
jgi:integrase